MYWKGPKTEQDFPDFSSDSQKVYKAFMSFSNYSQIIMFFNLTWNKIILLYTFFFYLKQNKISEFAS